MGTKKGQNHPISLSCGPYINTSFTYNVDINIGSQSVLSHKFFFHFQERSTSQSPKACLVYSSRESLSPLNPKPSIPLPFSPVSLTPLSPLQFYIFFANSLHFYIATSNLLHLIIVGFDKSTISINFCCLKCERVKKEFQNHFNKSYDTTILQ